MPTRSAGPRPAFVFPGQGSQYPGMAAELSWCGPQGPAMVAEAERITELPLEELGTRADAATLADPQIAQILVFVHSMAQLYRLRADGAEPHAVAGHSLGEYSALVAAGCLDWQAALHVVAARGRAMAEAARHRPGSMAAVVGLDPATVTDLCQAVSEPSRPVVVANVNSGRQVVVSGDGDAVAELVAAASAAGAFRAKRLAVGGAYHSQLMAPAEATLAPAVRGLALRPPRVPLVSSVTGELVEDIAAHRDVLLGQITATVRWHATVDRVAALGVTGYVEVGPGKVLRGLGREIDRTAVQVGAGEADQARRAARDRPARVRTTAATTGVAPGPAIQTDDRGGHL